MADGEEGRRLPLERYAALGDGRSVALVGDDGSVDWWCVPSLDSPPLLGRLLDPAGGSFSIRPRGEYQTERAYRPDSNVLETLFVTPTGKARLVEALNSSLAGRLPWSELARRVEGLEGTVELDVELRLGNRLGTVSPWRERNANGDLIHVGDLVATLRLGEGVERLRADDDGTSARIVAVPGSRAVVALVAVEDQPLAVPALAAIDARIDQSDEAWRRWAQALSYDGAYAGAVRRSALALKLLLYSPSGAVAAAATTSLPEGLGGGKNYDYRFAWVRDAAYTIKAFLRVGADAEAQAAFAWLLRVIREHGPRLRVFYTLKGELPDREVDVPAAGYAGSRPVRLGNRARTQRQLGTYGDLLEIAALFVERGNVLGGPAGRFLADLTDLCADEWRRPDAGIWELEEERHHTISKIGCWVALDRAVRLARGGHIEATRVERWERERGRVRAWIDENCWSEAKQAYTQHNETEDLDASLLLATRLGFDRPDRLDLTRQAVQRELCRGPLVYRYGGVEREEGAFLACSFWLVEALAILGHPAEARRVMDELTALTAVNHGLLNEMMDPETGAMLGNMPQALSHLAQIHAAIAVTDAEREAAAAAASG